MILAGVAKGPGSGIQPQPEGRKTWKAFRKDTGVFGLFLLTLFHHLLAPLTHRHKILALLNRRHLAHFLVPLLPKRSKQVILASGDGANQTLYL
jgi:hypothetical protein